MASDSEGREMGVGDCSRSGKLVGYFSRMLHEVVDALDARFDIRGETTAIVELSFEMVLRQHLTISPYNPGIRLARDCFGISKPVRSVAIRVIGMGYGRTKLGGYVASNSRDVTIKMHLTQQIRVRNPAILLVTQGRKERVWSRCRFGYRLVA